MQIIHKLPSQLADMIAAGEVVERPGSVVKELIENSIDAGATALTVEIQHGGMSYIRVTDNGAGMSREDAEMAFLRHATSKLKDERGLEAIRTLGFRGEALAAISAVSRVELMTREKGQSEGVALTLEGGEIIENSPVGCPVGTTMIVRDLFFNTPARLKFMKKDTAEAANVSAVVTRIALSHPEVAFLYIKDGKEEASTPGSGDISASIYTLLGRDFSKGLLETENVDENISVHGYISSPASARGNRGYQYFYVNGRYIKSPLLQAALEQGFKNSLFAGRFPGCVLYIVLKPNAVDVNVHPAKTEVRFQYERAVFDSVYYAVKSALETQNAPVEIKLRPVPETEEIKKVEAKPGFYKTLTAEEYLKGSVKGHVFKAPTAVYNSRPFAAPTTEKVTPEPYSPVMEAKPEPRYIQEMLPILSGAKNEPDKEEETQTTDYRIIGEAFSGYIIVEQSEELMLIDKHAAHERLIFDRLKSSDREQMSQMLLTPVIAEIEKEDAALLLDNLSIFDKLGFELEDFGGGSVLIRRLPADVDLNDASGLIGELCQNLRLGSRPGYLGVIDEILSTMACKAAIKIGKSSAPQEWKSLVEHVMTGKIKYCPHGRPVTMTLTKLQLEKGFKRK